MRACVRNRTRILRIGSHDSAGSRQTHLGRFSAGLCMMIGPMLVSLMTATFSRNMALNARETRLMHTLDKDRLEARVLTAAATVIQLWARRCSYMR